MLETFVPPFDDEDAGIEADDEEQDYDCGIIYDRRGNPEGCTNAGSEQCDFECPHRNWLYQTQAKAAKRQQNHGR